MTLLRIYAIGVFITCVIIAICCAYDPMIRIGFRKVRFEKALVGAIFWPIFLVFAIFFVGKGE